MTPHELEALHASLLAEIVAWREVERAARSGEMREQAARMVAHCDGKARLVRREMKRIARDRSRE